MVRISKNQVGDTIVEVMLAMAVVGMVLGASYATATRALRTGRFAQEHTEALKVAESQLEKLKFLASENLLNTDPNYIFDPGNTFCIGDDIAKHDSVDTDFPTSCQGISDLYDIAVKYYDASDPSTPDIFHVQVTWDGAGNSPGNVELSYRLYP